MSEAVRRNQGRRRLRCLARCAVAALYPIAAGAEADRGDALLPPLEETVVTATRMERTLDRVPAAVSVVGEEDLQLARQQLTLDEGLSRVPGLFMQNQYNFAQRLRISIRGFGARADSGTRGIKILVDGIPETLPDGQGQVSSIDLGATREVQVIRGPSSALYGNASGGVVQLTTGSGDAGAFVAGRVAAGAFGFRKLQLKTGGSAGRADYFLSLSDSALDGYRRHSANESTQVSGRVRFDLGGERRLTAVFNHTDQPVALDPGGVTAELAAADPRAAWPGNVQFDAGEAFTQSRLGFSYSMPLGEGHEITARNYYSWRDYANRLPFVAGGRVELERFFAGGGFSYSREGYWLDRPNRLIVGVDYDRQQDDRLRYDNAFGAQGALAFDQRESVSTRALFVQNELRVTRNLDLTLGLRLDEVTFEASDRFLADGDDSGRRRLDDASPMVGVVYGAAPGLSVYATYSSAFESPTTTELVRPQGGGFDPDVGPQVAKSYEVGVRGLLDERHHYEVALFRIEVEDELIPLELMDSPGRSFYVNAGSSSRRGLELALISRPARNLRTTFSYTYSDFVFEEPVDAADNDVSGNRLPGSPKSLLFGELSYRHPRGWFAALQALHVGEQQADNANTAAAGSYTLANLRLGLERTVGDTLLLAPFIGVNNLLDERYSANVRINASGGRYYEPAPGRHVYAGISVRRGWPR